MRSTHLPIIAKVRFLVGALGERRAWWATQFTFPASRRSLEIVFPRTAPRAALESVTEAARRTHDDSLDAFSFHLFRLPIHLEDRLAGHLAQPEVALAWPSATEEPILAELAVIAGGGAPVLEQGPQRLGQPATLNHAAAFKSIAAAYLLAARGGFRVIPYFKLEA
jgi:hypothetical protein